MFHIPLLFRPRFLRAAGDIGHLEGITSRQAKEMHFVALAM